MKPMRQVVIACLLLAALAIAVPAHSQTEPDLQRMFAGMLKTQDVRIDSVPDIYPGGYARISVYARKASMGGVIVDEVWMRVVGATLDVAALRRGELRITDYRDSSIHVRLTWKGLQDYFVSINAFKDIRLWSDGEFVYGEGTVPLGEVPAKVWLKGFFVVGGTKDVYFYIYNMRVNGLPVFDPIIRVLEGKYNPVLTQSLWPVTFPLRSLKMNKDMAVISSLADATAPCAFCTSGDAPVVNP